MAGTPHQAAPNHLCKQSHIHWKQKQHLLPAEYFILCRENIRGIGEYPPRQEHDSETNLPAGTTNPPLLLLEQGRVLNAAGQNPQNEIYPDGGGTPCTETRCHPPNTHSFGRRRSWDMLESPAVPDPLLSVRQR
jgi:hypothetical protein